MYFVDALFDGLYLSPSFCATDFYPAYRAVDKSTATK